MQKVTRIPEVQMLRIHNMDTQMFVKKRQSERLRRRIPIGTPDSKLKDPPMCTLVDEKRDKIWQPGSRWTKIQVWLRQLATYSYSQL